MLAGCFIKSLDDEKQKMCAQQIELNLRTRQLEESRIALVKQDEIERRLFAADLHDQVLNDLRSVFARFENYTCRPDKEVEESIRAQLKQTMSDVRGIMDDLCPIILSEFGLPAAIEDRLDRAAQEGNFDVRFNLAADKKELDALSDVERQLIYRLVQECINNTRKHACASLLSVIITRESDQLVLRVNDNGNGVDLEKLNQSSRGTLYMRLRAAIIGARVGWMPGPAGRGTTVEIRMTSRVRT
jgi:signal transduction histidine kinase